MKSWVYTTRELPFLSVRSTPGEMPLSMTATPMPLPSRPADQAAVAFEAGSCVVQLGRHLMIDRDMGHAGIVGKRLPEGRPERKRAALYGA